MIGKPLAVSQGRVFAPAGELEDEAAVRGEGSEIIETAEESSKAAANNEKAASWFSWLMRSSVGANEEPVQVFVRLELYNLLSISRTVSMLKLPRPT